MSQLALALACTVAMLAACAEGGTVSIEQWSNPDCSGMREYGEEYDLSSDGTCLQSTGLSIVPRIANIAAPTMAPRSQCPPTRTPTARMRST